MNRPPKTPAEGMKILKAWLRKKADPKEQLHKTLFRIAAMSKSAGLPQEHALLIAKAYAAGDMLRKAPEREIVAAVASAYAGTYTPGPRFPDPNPELMAEVDSYPSPVPYPILSEEPPEFFLRQMFAPTDLLCIGATAFAMDTRSLQEWDGMLRPMQFLVPSPMISETGPRKQDGQPSFHAESNTGPRKFLITEFDGASKPAQMARIRSLEARGPLFLAAVVDSGGKSLHAFWRASRAENENFEFFSFACRLGADPRLWLRSQFARLPGGTRAGTRQEILLWQN
jgi:hypothetical protein